jgi:G:T-mismatch repair DNA endonuclease (very short patch repair protein)
MVFKELSRCGWRVLKLWECAVKGKARFEPDELLKAINVWLVSGGPSRDIVGRKLQP